MKPTIIQVPAFTLVGPEAHFISAMSPDANNMKIIPPLWHELVNRLAEIGPARDGFKYGACRCLPPEKRKHDHELEYMAGISVDASAKAPKGMGQWTIPASTFAHFIHRGPISKLCDTIGYAHGTWLPQSEFAYDPRSAELERYDQRFDGESSKSELDFLLPIRPKAKK